jgi:hypothetical protein
VGEGELRSIFCLLFLVIFWKVNFYSIGPIIIVIPID